jgi:hypothetical protein
MRNGGGGLPQGVANEDVVGPDGPIDRLGVEAAISGRSARRDAGS